MRTAEVARFGSMYPTFIFPDYTVYAFSLY